MHAVFSVDNGCKRDDDAIIATRCIIVEVKECPSRAVGRIVFEFFKEDKGLCLATWASAEESRVDTSLEVCIL